MPYLTVITLKVLSLEAIPDDMTPADVYRETIVGDYSGTYDWDSQAIDEQQCKTLLVEQGSDIDFFYPDHE